MSEDRKPTEHRNYRVTKLEAKARFARAELAADFSATARHALSESKQYLVRAEAEAKEDFGKINPLEQVRQHPLASIFTGVLVGVVTAVLQPRAGGKKVKPSSGEANAQAGTRNALIGLISSQIIGELMSQSLPALTTYLRSLVQKQQETSHGAEEEESEEEIEPEREERDENLRGRLYSLPGRNL